MLYRTCEICRRLSMPCRSRSEDKRMNAVRPEYETWKAGVLARVDPATTALIAIDLQRDFCSTDGALAALGSDVSPSASVVSRLERFLPSVRPLVNFVAFF